MMILSKKDYRFLDVARSVAMTSTYHKQSVGCCVVYKDVVLSIGCNMEKTHTLQKIYNKFRNFDIDTSENKLHAEIHALSLLLSQKENIFWQKVTIYVYRVNFKGRPASSKPCPACSRLIKDLGIGFVCYFDNEKGDFVKEKWC